MNQFFNPVNGELSYANVQTHVNDFWNIPGAHNDEAVEASRQLQPIDLYKYDPIPEGSDPVMKAVVGGSAADILLAMAMSRHEQIKHSQLPKSFRESHLFSNDSGA